MKQSFKFRIFSGFILKILGLVFMTLDHVGLFLCEVEKTKTLGTIFRYFGRLALPIFIFLLVEGVKHTKNEIRYLIRIGVLALAFFFGQLFIFLKYHQTNVASPIIDLLVVAITLLLLKRKDKFSIFSIIPIAFSIVSFILLNLEKSTGIPYNFPPFYLKLSYPLYSLLLGLIFFYSDSISKFILRLNKNTENLTETEYLELTSQIISSFGIIFVSTIFYITFTFFNVSYCDIPCQIYALFSFVPIIFYSGKRGYNKKWFQYGCYIYAPLHIVIIFAIFALL